MKRLLPALTGAALFAATGLAALATPTVASAADCTPAQVVANGGFESGSSPWTAPSGAITADSGQSAHSGSSYAWLDGYGSSHTDTLSQSVTLPAGCGTATLGFWLHVDTAETTAGTAYDKLTVKLGSTTVATHSNLDALSGYVHKTVDVSAFAGQTATLAFTGVEDASLQTSFVLDDVTLDVSGGGTTPSPATRPAPRPRRRTPSTSPATPPVAVGPGTRA